jgi:hypothetical protein
MMTSNAGLGELVRELRATLEAISLGLVEGLPDRLLDTELVAAQAALRRCERLGATVVSLNDVYATRHGYGPSGHFARVVTGDAAGVLQARG